MKSNEKNREPNSGDIGFRIDPEKVYDASECRKILKCSRATLCKYVEDGFPLRPVMSGIALGKDVIEWIQSLPIKKQARGNRSKCAAT